MRVFYNPKAVLGGDDTRRPVEVVKDALSGGDEKGPRRKGGRPGGGGGRPSLLSGGGNVNILQTIRRTLLGST